MKSITVYPSRAVLRRGVSAGIVSRSALLFLVTGIVLASPLSYYSTAFAATQYAPQPLMPSVSPVVTTSVWWPVEGVTVTGTQPWKALLTGKDVSEYDMYWQVDGGQWNQMPSSYDGYPHKEARVDLSGWKWKGTGPYVITFIGTTRSGAVLAKKSVTIYTGLPAQSGAYVPAPTPAPAPAPATQTSSGSVTTPVEPSPAPTPVVTSNLPAQAGNPLSGARLYVDPYSSAANAQRSASGDTANLLGKIASNAVSRWFGGWNGNVQADVASYVNVATAAGSLPVLVAYNIPGRDCGGYSAGGAQTMDAYKAWIRSFAQGIGSKKAAVILEPDSVALTSCLNGTQLSERYAMLNDAISVLKSLGNTSVYLDAGHANWLSASEIAGKLSQAGVAKADGFALNVSNFETTTSNASYGASISSLINGKHFVIDTSRNGRGANGEWCNPSGRGLGDRPTTSTGNSLIDAYLWVKAPGESDGTCNGGPSAGTFWLDYALGLARKASF